MTEKRFDAFISYRREGGFMPAKVVRDSLRDKGVLCYMDVEEDRSGDFDIRLLDAIRNAPNFLLILSPGALDRCVNAEDWVRQEILEAVRQNKTIIPIDPNHFIWNEDLSAKLPQELQTIKTKQWVQVSQQYLSATMDKIISYMTDLHLPKQSRRGEDSLPASSGEFFLSVIGNSENPCVDMAFHGGAEWRTKTDKLEILEKMIRKNAKIRVLSNSAQTMEQIRPFMAQPLKKYIGFDECVANWKELMEQFPDHIEFRVCPVPLMHRLYIIRREDQEGAANVKYYSYGPYTSDKDCRCVFSHRSKEYQLYTEEFEFLWERSQPI